MRQINVIQQSC